MNQHTHKLMKVINLLLNIISSLIDYEELCGYVVECLPLLELLIQMSSNNGCFSNVCEIVCCLCLDENENSVRYLVMCENICDFFINALRMNRCGLFSSALECNEEKIYNSMYVIINYLSVNNYKLQLFMNKIELAGGRDIIENDLNRHMNSNSLMYEKVNYIFNSFSFDISESSNDSSTEQKYN